MFKVTSATTSDKDLGAREIIAQAEAFNGAVVDTGLFEGEKHPGTEYTIAQIGAVNEFGSKDGKIPERSFIRRAVRECEAKWNSLMDKGMGLVMEGRAKVFPTLVAFGEHTASDVRATINRVTEPKKAESTMRREGGALQRTKAGKVKKGAYERQLRFDHPLIWLGYMKAAVRSRILLHGQKKMTPRGSR